MRTYIAKQGERLDYIYFKFYGPITYNEFNDAFYSFVLSNKHLINTPTLQGGEVVYLPILKEQEQKQEVGLWE